MLDVKKTLAKIITWISNYQPPHYEYVGNAGSTIFNGTWTAPNDGVLVMVGVPANSSANLAYWYVTDRTQGIQIGTLFWQSANQTRRSTSFPVIKGHQYYTDNSSRMATANAYFYKLVGGVVHRLLNTLQSLCFKGVVAC